MPSELQCLPSHRVLRVHHDQSQQSRKDLGSFGPHRFLHQVPGHFPQRRRPSRDVGSASLGGARHLRRQPSGTVVVRVPTVPRAIDPPVSAAPALVRSTRPLPPSHTSMGREPSAAFRTRSFSRHGPRKLSAPPRRQRGPRPASSLEPLPSEVGHFSRADGGQFSRALKTSGRGLRTRLRRVSRTCRDRAGCTTLRPASWSNAPGPTTACRLSRNASARSGSAHGPSRRTLPSRPARNCAPCWPRCERIIGS